MPEPVYRTYLFLAQLVAFLPIGTNQGIVHLLWTILTGKLLNSRGAIFPALSEAGLNDQQCRRAEAALRVGAIKIARLLERLSLLIPRECKSSPLLIGQWKPLLIDWVGFYRPQLKGCLTKHFSSVAGKPLPAIELGMIARCLSVDSRKIPLLTAVVRGGDTLSLLKATRTRMQKEDVLIADRQVKISHLHQENIRHFVIRGAIDFTARETTIPVKTGRGRKPTQGQIVRPLARTYKTNKIGATQAHREESFTYQGRTLMASWFDNLVVKDCPLCFHCVVICDPKYKQPWVLLTDLQESSETIFHLYRSRWKIEQLPQTGKQLMGGHRSFVHAEESRYRLPERCLFAATLSLYLSATSCAVATGFWDRHPKRTPGRFRRVLSGAGLPALTRAEVELRTLPGLDDKVKEILDRIRVKRSVFSHLPLGIMAHCRRKATVISASLTGN